MSEIIKPSSIKFPPELKKAILDKKKKKGLPSFSFVVISDLMKLYKIEQL